MRGGKANFRDGRSFDAETQPDISDGELGCCFLLLFPPPPSLRPPLFSPAIVCICRYHFTNTLLTAAAAFFQETLPALWTPRLTIFRDSARVNFVVVFVISMPPVAEQCPAHHSPELYHLQLRGAVVVLLLGLASAAKLAGKIFRNSTRDRCFHTHTTFFLAQTFRSLPKRRQA